MVRVPLFKFGPLLCHQHFHYFDLFIIVNSQQTDIVQLIFKLFKLGLVLGREKIPVAFPGFFPDPQFAVIILPLVTVVNGQVQAESKTDPEILIKISRFVIDQTSIGKPVYCRFVLAGR